MRTGGNSNTIDVMTKPFIVLSLALLAMRSNAGVTAGKPMPMVVTKISFSEGTPTESVAPVSGLSLSGNPIMQRAVQAVLKIHPGDYQIAVQGGRIAFVPAPESVADQVTDIVVTAFDPARPDRFTQLSVGRDVVDAISAHNTGNFVAASEAFGRFFDSSTPTQSPVNTGQGPSKELFRHYKANKFVPRDINESVESLGLLNRSMNVLRRHGIKTIGELVNLGTEGLEGNSRIGRVGNVIRADIRFGLARAGHVLRGDPGILDQRLRNLPYFYVVPLLIEAGYTRIRDLTDITEGECLELILRVNRSESITADLHMRMVKEILTGLHLSFKHASGQ